MKSNLLINTYDGSLLELRVRPQCRETTVEFDITYYDEEDKSVSAVLIFENVISVDFEVNYFDNYIGAELFGFYEIEDRDRKRDMIERIFENRKEGYLASGAYDYDAEDEHDMLNCRQEFDEIDPAAYHLYQQQTQGGVYHILAGGYELVRK